MVESPQQYVSTKTGKNQSLKSCGLSFFFSQELFAIHIPSKIAQNPWLLCEDVLIRGTSNHSCGLHSTRRQAA
jgi:hypothetical protein